jgi:hypothetical protein
MHLCLPHKKIGAKSCSNFFKHQCVLSHSQSTSHQCMIINGLPLN